MWHAGCAAGRVSPYCGMECEAVFTIRAAFKWAQTGHAMQHHHRKCNWRGLPLLLAATMLAACAPLQPPRTETEALQAWGPPTSRYALPGGGQRLEYATGPYGRATWMLDLDGQGQVQGARQVLTDTELMAVQAAMPMPANALLQWIGRPGETRHGGRAGGRVWAWRYQTNDCLWFLVSVDDAGTAQNAAFMTDPRCDQPSDARD